MPRALKKRSRKPSVLSDFKKFIVALESAGYKVEVPVPGFARVYGKSIFGGFCAPGDKTNPVYLDGKIAVDHYKCFDKWSKCPLVAVIPKTEAETKALIRHMRKLGTKQGYELSNSYDYIRNNPFPYQI